MDVQPLPHRRSAGYSLLEVLVAALVLSIGLLGTAGIFVATLKDTRAGLNRSKAIALAWDMAERIRANRTAGSAYKATVTDAGTPADCAATHSLAAPATCTPEELAAHDIWEWKQKISDVEQGLPQGAGSITRETTTAPPRYTIQVSWIESHDSNGNPVSDSVQLVTQL